jgi:2-polyprenyl-3-methyl-5-hydroxy-6-metoxy-1,4-benzoquinol methylase
MNSWEKKWNKKEKNGTSVTYPLGIISKFGYDIAKINIQRVIKSVKLERNSMIIDIGCGEGRTLSYFSELGFEKLTGIDNTKSAIEKCKSGNLKEAHMYGCKCNKIQK